MPVDALRRERLRQGLLGPLGEEVTGLLMQELDQAGLRAHMDERFLEVDKRLAEIDKRFAEVNARIDTLTPTLIAELRRLMAEDARQTKAIVYTVCGGLAIVMVTALVAMVLQAAGAV